MMNVVKPLEHRLSHLLLGRNIILYIWAKALQVVNLLNCLLFLLLNDFLRLLIELRRMLELLLLISHIMLLSLLIFLLLNEFVLLLVLEELVKISSLLLGVGLRLEGTLLKLCLLLELLENLSLLLFVFKTLLISLIEVLKRKALLLVSYFFKLLLCN